MLSVITLLVWAPAVLGHPTRSHALDRVLDFLGDYGGGVGAGAGNEKAGNRDQGIGSELARTTICVSRNPSTDA